jgi:fatty-acyl-CoA synthase
MAGSPCPIETMKRVTQEMAAREITIGYGQTEASPLITQTRTDDPIELRVGTVGRPLPGFEAKIVDVQTGAELGDGQPGEFCGRGHGVMIGYYNMPDKTAEVIDAEGWLHTGDVAVVDSDGYFQIVDRLKELIKYKGFQVPPAELEALLVTHPAVADAAVVGMPDDEAGELPKAFIALRPGASATAEELQDFVAAQVATYKQLRLVEFVETIPKSASGKILRRLLRDRG